MSNLDALLKFIIVFNFEIKSNTIALKSLNMTLIKTIKSLYRVTERNRKQKECTAASKFSNVKSL